MQFSGLSLLSAPVTTGHPHGLPSDRQDPMEQTRIKPIADTRDPEARLREGQAPSKFWSAVQGEPDPSSHTAPPSIMQITISRMLDEQNIQKSPEPDSTEAPPKRLNTSEDVSPEHLNNLPQATTVKGAKGDSAEDGPNGGSGRTDHPAYGNESRGLELDTLS